MVGSKCRDFKNREVSNVNAPIFYLLLNLNVSFKFIIFLLLKKGGLRLFFMCVVKMLHFLKDVLMEIHSNPPILWL